MLSTNGEGVPQAAGAGGDGGGGGGGGGGEDPGSGGHSAGRRAPPDGEEGQRVFGVQEGLDGSRYEGEFQDRLKHGRGKYTWKNGEYHDGSYYKDYRHGHGLYCWPRGERFIGKFYLNRREGYGEQRFPGGARFQGLYHTDYRFGPGVVTYSDGCQDVGLWAGDRLVQLCSPLVEGFSLQMFPEYAAYVDPAAVTDSLTQPPVLAPPETRADRDLLLVDEEFIYPPGIERFSTNGDFLPLPPGRRRELDQLFYGELWEPELNPYLGCKRDPYADLPLQARMRANIHAHRRLAAHVSWDVAAVLSLNRKGFGPKGILEVTSELLMRRASRGELQAVSESLRPRLVYADVADSRGNTPLMAATINNHHDVIHLLLDKGVNVDRLNCEGMSALAVCHVLYYPFDSLNATVLESPQTRVWCRQVLQNPPSCGSGSQISQVGVTTDTGELHNRPQTSNPTPSHGSDRTAEEPADHVSHHGCNESNDSELVPGLNQPETDAEGLLEEDSRETETETEDRRDWSHIEWEAEGEERRIEEEHDEVWESEVAVQDEEPSPEQTSASVGSVTLQDTQETAHKMAAMTIENRVRLETLKLLLQRGADPNASKVPMPVLFLAIMASDTEAVRRLLLCGARTDIPLPPERKGLHPLHVAAALPGPAGLKITELLLCAITDTDAQACDGDDVYEPDRINRKSEETLSPAEVLRLTGGGRTALHVACQRVSDYQNASKVVALLLSHRASTHLLWSGHSPLSLAIASGNEQAVEELLRGGADPNIPLGRGVGSALCAVANIHYHMCGNRPKLLYMLADAGADFLLPVMVGDVVGNAVDFAHDSFNQDTRIANTPFHALNLRERETFTARRRLLTLMGDLLRQQIAQRKDEEKHRTPLLHFCYHCGRSVGLKLTPCSRCHKVAFCSTGCKLKAWEGGHKGECVKATGSEMESVSESTDGLLNEEVSEKQVYLKENYSCN